MGRFLKLLLFWLIQSKSTVWNLAHDHEGLASSTELQVLNTAELWLLTLRSSLEHARLFLQCNINAYMHILLLVGALHTSWSKPPEHGDGRLANVAGKQGLAQPLPSLEALNLEGSVFL